MGQRIDYEKAKRRDSARHTPHPTKVRQLLPSKKQLAFLAKLEGEGVAPPATRNEAKSRIQLALNVEKRKRNAKMAAEPPSEKQVKALKKFGLEVPATKLEASDLIGPRMAEAKKKSRRYKRNMKGVTVTFVDPSTLKEQA